MDPRVKKLHGELVAWATNQPGLKRLWIYGSRARGTHRPDSDLDIAFEIERLQDQATIDAFHEDVKPTWRSDLSQLFSLDVHLEPHVGDATNVASYTSDSGVLVYERKN